MNIKEEKKVLTVYLTGELDHHAAGPMREETDKSLLLYRPKTLILDFSGLSFMDSSGVGFVMGRYKKAAELSCTTVVEGLTPQHERIMRLSGLSQLVEFRNSSEPKENAHSKDKSKNKNTGENK